MDDLEKLQEIIDKAEENSIVFFGGAGVSTESGIPDFRSADGLYSEKNDYQYPPEMIISHSFFVNNTPLFYKFYCEKMLPSDDIQPNQAHYFLAELEDAKKLKCVVTQNIDGLHQKAGSKKVLELHGSVHRNYCQTCHKFFELHEMLDCINNEGVPICNNCSCQGTIKPDVVLYEEPLDNSIMQESVTNIAKANTLIVAGSSLSVYPAAGLLDYFRGENLIIINKDTTGRDNMADICISGKVGEIFGKLNV